MRRLLFVLWILAGCAEATPAARGAGDAGASGAVAGASDRAEGAARPGALVPGAGPAGQPSGAGRPEPERVGAAAPTLPPGARLALELPAGPLGAPERLALFSRADGVVAAVARSAPTTVQLVPLGGALSVLPPAPPPDSVPGRLFAVPQGEGAAIALELAGATPAVALSIPGKRERLGSLRPCALAASGGSTWVMGDRPATAPGEPEGGPELVLFALGVRGVRADVPAGLSEARAEGDLCAALPRRGGLLLAWTTRSGAILVRATDPAGRPTGPARELPLRPGDRASAPALVAWGEGALLAHVSRLDGAIRGFKLGAGGTIEDGPFELTPPHRDGPVGGPALVALPRGGFALAFHAARVDLSGSPTELALVSLGADGRPTGPPVSLLSPLAHAPGPAALATDGSAIYAGAVLAEPAGKVARVVRLPLP